MNEFKDKTTIDEELLLKLFRLSSPSNKEDKVQAFIKSFLSENKIDFISDKMGNIFNLNIANAPLLSAHMDTVEDVSKDSHLMKYIRIYENKEFGKYLRGYGIIGGDDKCGIFIAISLLKKYPNKINFIFSVNEEHGMTGIKSVIDNQKFDNVLYGIIIDRRGAGDIICVDKNYGTKIFEEELERIGKDYNFKSASGAASDAGYISEKISCANISAGYYNPHSKKEFVIIDDLINSMNYAEKLITTIKIKFAAPIRSYTKDTSYGGYNYKRCKICYSADSYKKLTWSISFKDWFCADCAKKMAETLKEKEFTELLEEKKETAIPISTHYHEGD